MIIIEPSIAVRFHVGAATRSTAAAPHNNRSMWSVEEVNGGAGYMASCRLTCSCSFDAPWVRSKKYPGTPFTRSNKLVKNRIRASSDHPGAQEPVKKNEKSSYHPFEEIAASTSENSGDARLTGAETSRTIIEVCAAKGPTPRYPRVWKTNRKIGTISKAVKLVQSIKELSNVKEEVYGALDSYVAWELEFPLVTVKKALKTLEYEHEWKRIIQVTKWMLSKGQGKTMGSYFTLLNALAEDDRLDEAEELWTKLLMQYMEALPRRFFDKMISLYYKRGMHEKMFEVFADLDELGVRPSTSVVSMVGDVFKELGMMDKYEKLHRKYPPPQWEYRYIKGKRVRIKVQGQSNKAKKYIRKHDNVQPDSDLKEDDSSEETSDVIDDEQFEQDTDAKCMEPEQISDESYESM